MALMTTTGPIPKDAVLLSRSQAVTYQWTQIFEWPVESDVWPFKWGIGGLASIAGGAGAEINRLYRNKLKLKNHGFVSSTFPMIITPAMISAALHIQLITNDLILRDTKCPLCLQYKAAGVQTSIAMVYPMILSPITNFLFASRNATYRVPYYTEVGATFALWWKFTKPMGYTLFAMAVGQGLAAAVVTYYEAEYLYKIQTKLLMKREGVMINDSEIINE